MNTTHSNLVGLHDYEQYYSHIYVKYFRRAVRQPTYIPELIDRILKRRMDQPPSDLDYTVALYGLYAGQGKTETYTDARHYPKIEDVLGIAEKLPLIL